MNTPPIKDELHETAENVNSEELESVLSAEAAEASAEIARMALIARAADERTRQAVIQREQALGERDRAMLERDRVMLERDRAMLERDRVMDSIAWRASNLLYRFLQKMPIQLSRPARRLLEAGRTFLSTGTVKAYATRASGAVDGDRPRMLGNDSTAHKSSETLNLFDDEAVLAAVDRPREQVLWLPQHSDSIATVWAAARFCIDLLRRRSELRERFPQALSAGESGEFYQWITGNGGDEFLLSKLARHKIREAYSNRLSTRVRQVYFSRPDLRMTHPLGLLPPGRRDLFEWFICIGQVEECLRLEEIWWFFLECAENPPREVVRTYLFSPAWQKLYPDGLTIFGRSALANWLSEVFRIRGSWTDPKTWPIDLRPAEQIRLAYWARPEWQLRFVDALSDVASARCFVNWLASSGSDLPEEGRAWCSGLRLEETVTELTAPGVNILGHFCYPSGLRTSAEAMRDALQLTGLNVSLRDLRTDASDEPNHADFSGVELYDITIIHVQPEPLFDTVFKRSDLFERNPRPYRIGYWYWELDTIPESWIFQARQVDEIWAPTTFVADALRKRFGERVYTLFPGVRIPRFRRRGRNYFGLPDEHEFTFLFVFHLNSVMERKNPLGLIRAFQRAFSPDEPARLILKTGLGHRYPVSLETILAAGARSKLTVIDRVFSQDETISLIDTCDAYVSLHRSEGLGLTLAEAMLLGKPVIATRYSGNLDFMNDANSLLVDYRLVSVGKSNPPYDADGHWAEASVDHAAFLMRKLYENRVWAADLGAQARTDAHRRLSLEKAGQRLQRRLSQISRSRREG